MFNFPRKYIRLTTGATVLAVIGTSAAFLMKPAPVHAKLVGENYSTGLIIGGHGLRSILHATGTRCAMPKVEIPTGVDPASLIQEAEHDRSKLPVVKCEYKLKDQTTLVTLTATKIVPVQFTISERRLNSPWIAHLSIFTIKAL